MTDPDGLAEAQARGTADLARAIADGPPFIRPAHYCAWGDDAWHRAVSRLICNNRPEYKRLLAEERERP